MSLIPRIQLYINFVTIFVNVLGMSLMEGKSNAFDECKAKFLQTFKVISIILFITFNRFLFLLQFGLSFYF